MTTEPALLLKMDGPALAYESYRITLVAESLANDYIVRRSSLQLPRGRRPAMRRPAAAIVRQRMSVSAPPAMPEAEPPFMDMHALIYESHRITMAAENLARQLLNGWKIPPDPTRAVHCGALLEQLYRRHSAEIRRYVTRSFGAGPSDAEDVVQAVFERYAWQAGERDVANPIAFLIGMARNHVLDQRRRQSVRERYAADLHLGGNQSDFINAERIVASRQQLAIIQGAIATLDDRSREILLMSRMDGLSSAEIARRRDCSPTLIKRIIATALETCRQALDGERDGQTSRRSRQ